jgi:hypothetical protein
MREGVSNNDHILLPSHKKFHMTCHVVSGNKIRKQFQKHDQVYLPESMRSLHRYPHIRTIGLDKGVCTPIIYQA